MNYFNKHARTIFLGCVVVVLFSLCIFRLVQLQIVNGAQYRSIAEQKLFMSMNVKAPRGNILDRYGRVLATDRNGFSVQVQKTELSTEEFNGMLFRLIGLLESNGVTLTDPFPVTMEEPFDFTYTDGDVSAYDAQMKWKKAQKVEESLSAAGTVQLFADKYKISNDFSMMDKRKLVGVLYDMKTRGFSISAPYVIAKDVSPEVVAILKEKNADFSGVEVIEEPIRVYPNGELASHILGNVGVIYEEEYEKLKGKNYRMDAVLGKQGIELTFEDYLRGQDGIRGFEQTVSGIGDVVTSVPAQQGDNVILTLDSQLQKIMEKTLAETVAQISKAGGSGAGGDCNAGSAVCLDVRTGELLAMASYPSYDPAQYNKNYNQLLKNPAKPLWNRAIGGAYEPGSTFKMLTGITALEEGVITPSETILDEGKYRVYNDYQPECMEWKYGKTHGQVNMAKALEVSCNYYFFEVGHRVGIEKIDEYAKRFGLGQLTGIEVGGEVKGAVAGKENRQRLGGTWVPGDTLQAAIGQSDTLITPIQLANYVSTLVNGGTRYKPHLLKSVKDSKDGSTVVESYPEIQEQITMKQENWEAVMNGMQRVTEEGTASSVFKDFFVEVGGKTGTAEVPKGSNNGVFVAFAPFDNPEIALAVIIEHGTAGYKAAPIAKAVFQEYFSSKQINDVYKTNQLNR